MKRKEITMHIDAAGMHFSELNRRIRNEAAKGKIRFRLNNICGHRYLGAGLKGDDMRITVHGTPGNDLGAFMCGPAITVRGNTQDGTGNTMSSGKIVVFGSTGDIAGHSMKGGCLYIKGDAGYRAGIHMKEYRDMFPVVIIGGRARDFLGEYMAGGLIIVLDLERLGNAAGDFIGTGMHGGNIFIRGNLQNHLLGKEVAAKKACPADLDLIKKHLAGYCRSFQLDMKGLLSEPFMRLFPYTHRPYGKLYAY